MWVSVAIICSLTWPCLPNIDLCSTGLKPVPSPGQSSGHQWLASPVACTCMRWLLPQHLRPQPPKSVSLLSVAGTAAGGEDELLGLHAEIKRFVEAVSPTPAEVYTKAQALHTVIDACRQALQAGYPGMEVGGKNAARTTATSLCSAASLSGGSVRFQQTPSYISYIHVYQAALVQVAA